MKVNFFLRVLNSYARFKAWWCEHPDKGKLPNTIPRKLLAEPYQSLDDKLVRLSRMLRRVQKVPRHQIRGIDLGELGNNLLNLNAVLKLRETLLNGRRQTLICRDTGRPISITDSQQKRKVIRHLHRIEQSYFVFLSQIAYRYQTSELVSDERLAQNMPYRTGAKNDDTSDEIFDLKLKLIKVSEKKVESATEGVAYFLQNLSLDSVNSTTASPVTNPYQNSTMVS